MAQENIYSYGRQRGLTNRMLLIVVFKLRALRGCDKRAMAV